jgi:EAL domain-containing protein (putative c-di-GMP-specific phosphodiesterase class I)
LSDLRQLGVRLSIDDFGTGYSSLAYLKRFPVNHVKIDRSFVMGLTATASSDRSLVAAIIAMAGALNLTTIAEGVETAEQANALFELGSHRAQGYLYCPPVSSQDLAGAVARLNQGGQRGLTIPEIEPTPSLPVPDEQHS